MMLWIRILLVVIPAVACLLWVWRRFYGGSSIKVDPDDVPIEQFADELFRKGVYVLGCGGGVIAEPRHAISRLEHRYGREGILRLALRLNRMSAYDEEFKEGVRWCAAGIIYQLGSSETFDELIRLRTILLETGRHLPGEEGHAVTDQLIAALAKKLHLRLPEGVEEVDDQLISEVYRPDP